MCHRFVPYRITTSEFKVERATILPVKPGHTAPKVHLIQIETQVHLGIAFARKRRCNSHVPFHEFSGLEFRNLTINVVEAGLVPCYNFQRKRVCLYTGAGLF